MKRINTKIGDIFSIIIDNRIKKYFQYVASDLTQLNSDVIRSFKEEYSVNVNPGLSEIISGTVEFYAHCVIKLGLKMNLWEKIGNKTEVGDISQVLFRDTNDYGTRLGGEPIKTSQNWYVWHINDKKFTDVGRLEGKYLNSEIGIVVTPYDIVDRIKSGRYNFVYPDYK